MMRRRTRTATKMTTTISQLFRFDIDPNDEYNIKEECIRAGQLGAVQISCNHILDPYKPPSNDDQV